VDRLRSALAAPGSARLVGTLLALVGVVLLIVGLVALGGGGSGSSGAAPAPSSVPALPTSPSAASPSATRATTSPAPRPSTPPRTTAVPPASPTAAPPRTTAAARAPLTVLNNSVIRGLADRAASEAQNRGWQVAQVGNFAGRLAVTTVYYTPGDAAGEAAARELAREFGQIGQVLPRYAGLPPTPAGIVLVVTKDW
jgi:hypothetical protein